MSDNKPLCCQINDFLIECGEERVLEICQALAEHGVSREEINVLLKTEIIPQFEDWRADKLSLILTAIEGRNETKH